MKFEKNVKLAGLIFAHDDSQYKIAAAVDMDNTLLSMYVNGRRKMTATHKAALANFFKVAESAVE